MELWGLSEGVYEYHSTHQLSASSNVTWSVVITSTLAEGTYDVKVTVENTGEEKTLSQDTTVGEVTIDTLGLQQFYVTESGNGTCATWENACHLQTALAKASPGDEIWVAKGTYYPTSGTDR